MPAGKSRKGAPAAAPRSGGGDRIGALPDEILHRVLSFLPAQQAVRTCVLARRWLYLWKHASGLRIVGADGKASVHFEEVREFVDSLLLLRGSLPLETFEVKVTGAAVDVRHLRLWVRYDMMCNVQVLRLKVHGNAPALLRSEDPPLASRYLTNIVLHGLVFNNDFLDFSRCPALQDLKIKDCSFIHVEKISSQSLKYLDIVRGIFNLSYRTKIHTPNLDILGLDVSGGRTPILERMPLLVTTYVMILGNDCCSHSNNGVCGDSSCKGCIRNETSSVLLHGISQAKALDLTALPETFIFRRDLKWCPTFSQLKALTLTEHHHVHALACILEHSPVLESLKLYLLVLDKLGFNVNVKMNGRFHPTISTISPHLKRVKVRCGTMDKRVFKVLEFLSKLNISFSFKCKAEDESSTT